MEFKSISTKMPRDEITHVSNYCKKKGITPSSLIRDLLLNEIKLSIPQNVAGKNKIVYDKSKDNFSWIIFLDDGQEIEILKNISSSYLENLNDEISKSLNDRINSINKRKKGSVAIPTKILRRKKI